ncbi:hypothetical protein BaRGS_00010334, partial [Batillaria attramentaria]
MIQRRRRSLEFSQCQKRADQRPSNLRNIQTYKTQQCASQLNKLPESSPLQLKAILAGLHGSGQPQIVHNS